jgi:hypothetical protein
MTAFGVIGSYGATGTVVVSELRKSGDREILIGGRDLRRATPADVLDARSLPTRKKLHHPFRTGCSFRITSPIVALLPCNKAGSMVRRGE